MSAVATRPKFTPEDLLTMPGGDHFELVDGELVESVMGAESSWVGGRVYRFIAEFVERHGLGWVFNPECSYQCYPEAPNRVRRPDASFIRFGRFPGERLPEGHLTLPPDLAVEVTSPNDRSYEVDRKVGEYLRAGVRLVWVINPEERIALVYRPDGSAARLDASAELSGEDVLPGFRCPVADLFPPAVPAPAEPAA